MNYDDWLSTETDTDPPPFGDWCQHCEGEGFVEDEDGKHICPECNGRRCIEFEEE